MWAIPFARFMQVRDRLAWAAAHGQATPKQRVQLSRLDGYLNVLDDTKRVKAILNAK